MIAVLPAMRGRLHALAVRVPTTGVSLVDLTIALARPATTAAARAAYREEAEGRLRGILGWTDEPLVSADLNHDPHSSTFALDQTKVIDGSLVRVMSWYDNEWGFSHRMADTAAALGATLGAKAPAYATEE